MKSRIEKKWFDKLTTRNGGFALLFSVLIASLLLTIGLSIFNIALKELALSTASRQSIHSFFAADSGRECAKYWDLKSVSIPTVFDRYLDGENGGLIKCGNSNAIDFADTELTDGDITYLNPSNGPYTGVTDNIYLTSENTDINRSNFQVVIKKERNTLVDEICEGPIDGICTTIISYGYDSTDDDRVERAIEETY